MARPPVSRLARSRWQRLKAQSDAARVRKLRTKEATLKQASRAVAVGKKREPRAASAPQKVIAKKREPRAASASKKTIARKGEPRAAAQPLGVQERPYATWLRKNDKEMHYSAV